MFGDKSRENKEEIDRIIEVLDNEIKNNPTLIEIKKKWIVEKEILYDNTTAAIMATKISLQVIEKEGIDDLSADDLKNMIKSQLGLLESMKGNTQAEIEVEKVNIEDLTSFREIIELLIKKLIKIKYNIWQILDLYIIILDRKRDLN